MGQRQVRLGAALFNGDHTHLAAEVARLEAAGLDFIHHDVFDGHFIPDLGFSPHTIAALRPLTKLPFEVHLGALEPERFYAALAHAGTDLLLIHVESTPLPYEAAFLIRQQQMKVGMVLTMGTPITALEPLIPMLDAVLLLSRPTGESVQNATFDPRVLERTRRVRAMIDAAGAHVDLQVAGSVKREHVPQIVSAGATAIAMGSGIYKVSDMAAEVHIMRGLIATALKEIEHG
jgi:ribulose-phosphate 3-epimerase